LIYDLVTSIRNYLFDINIFKATEFEVSTIVVGNLSVGGTGKTPQIEYLIRLLSSEYNVAVLSRGYKRKEKGFILANKESNANKIGDEPFQYYKKFKNIQVAVDENRVHGIHKLLELDPKPEVILLDDAFQHRKVKGGLNIMLTAFDKLYMNDLILPAGNLRESRRGANRADIIVVTKCPSGLKKSVKSNIINKIKPNKNQEVYFSTIDYDEEVKGASEIQLNDLKNYNVLLVTGIANASPLVSYLESLKVNFKHLKYTDHHHFTRQELEDIKNQFKSIESNNKIILTTEKDYVRIFDDFEKLYYLSIKTVFLEGETGINNRIKEYVEKGSGNS
jgi:tetraacyldisaccharide 4'-kinase